jgi:MFS family permease
VIDRSDKRKLLLQGVLSYSICIIALIIVTSPFVFQKFNNRFSEISFYVIIFFTGVIRAFAGPTSSAIIAQLVPRNILHFAASISSTTWLSASILGHASAGFFIAWFGVHTTFYIVLLYILIASYGISRIKSKPFVPLDTENVNTAPYRVLLEIGDNAASHEFLKDPVNQQKIGKAIKQELLAWISEKKLRTKQ